MTTLQIVLLIVAAVDLLALCYLCYLYGKHDTFRTLESLNEKLRDLTVKNDDID